MQDSQTPGYPSLLPTLGCAAPSTEALLPTIRGAALSTEGLIPTLGCAALSLAALPTGPWSEIGPSPIFDDGSQTQMVYGNPAGRISAVALHPTDPNVIL